ncbi:hypothetical protein BH09MYX1_BH09MYX1_34650 [soil metagenome]
MIEDPKAPPTSVATQRAILDALPALVCLVDADGRITVVNRTWRHVADVDAPASVDAGVGESYLDVCDRARGPFSDEAPAVAAGIRAVLAGSTVEFSLDYPCHAPGRERWFRLDVAPSSPGAAP